MQEFHNPIRQTFCALFASLYFRNNRKYFANCILTISNRSIIAKKKNFRHVIRVGGLHAASSLFPMDRRRQMRQYLANLVHKSVSVFSPTEPPNVC